MKTKWNLDTFIQQSNIIHNNKYNYAKSVFINTTTKLIIICPEHGEFLKAPSKHIGTERAGCQICARIKRAADKTRFQHIQEVFDACTEAHNNKYVYVKLQQCHREYITVNDTLFINCDIHGLFKQTIDKHIYQQTTCPKCADQINGTRCRKTLEQFIIDASTIHQKVYDYSPTIYVNYNSMLNIKCNTHGIFTITAAGHLNGAGCPQCGGSLPEKIITNILNEHNIVFIPQYGNKSCKNKKTLKFDFYLPNNNIMIEYDGPHHFFPFSYGKNQTQNELTEQFNAVRQNDIIKTKWCETNGIILYRIDYKKFKQLPEIIYGIINTI